VTLPDELAFNIARESSRNLRRALLMLESCHVQKRDGLTKDQPVQKTDWELYIGKLAMEITKEQTPQRLMAAREKLYELLVNCIPADVIIKTLARELMKNLDDSLKQEVIEWAAFYEHRIALGSKEIFHLYLQYRYFIIICFVLIFFLLTNSFHLSFACREAFIAKFMAIYKRFLNEVFG